MFMFLDRIATALERLLKVMATISEQLAAATASLEQIGTALDNIAADEANLAKQIQDLKDQIANSGSVLTPADLAALENVTAKAAAMATKTAGIAAAVPDLPGPPPPPTA